MPYVITTHPTIDGAGQTTTAAEEAATTEAAVATLDEAREFVGDTLRNRDLYSQPDGDYTALGDQCASLPESGGTVGPLPDGTVIEVRRVTTEQLADAVPTASYRSLAVIIDAFNAS